MDTQVKEGDLISRVLARLGDGPAKPPGPDPESEEAEVSHRPMGASIGPEVSHNDSKFGGHAYRHGMPNYPSLPSRIPPGPSPLKGSPQDRFKEAVLGIPVDLPGPSASFERSSARPMGIDVRGTLSRIPVGLPNPHPSSNVRLSGGMHSASDVCAEYSSWSSSTPGYVNPNNPYSMASAAVHGDISAAGSRLEHNATGLTTWRRSQGNIAHTTQIHPMTARKTLTLECQKRKFNPEWRCWSSVDGRFGCHVMLQGVLVENIHTYATPLMAKTATAQKALPTVKRMPAPVKKEVEAGGGLRQHPWEGERRSGNIEMPHDSPPRHRSGTVVPATFRNDPLASQAFLEGLNLGCRMRDAEHRVSRSARKSRSPTRLSPSRGNDNLSYRHRSQLRDHDRERPKREPSKDRNYRLGYSRGREQIKSTPSSDRDYRRNRERTRKEHSSDRVYSYDHDRNRVRIKVEPASDRYYRRDHYSPYNLRR